MSFLNPGEVLSLKTSDPGAAEKGVELRFGHINRKAHDIITMHSNGPAAGSQRLRFQFATTAPGELPFAIDLGLAFYQLCARGHGGGAPAGDCRDDCGGARVVINL